PAEADVGAVVVREDLAGVVLVDLQPRGRNVLEILDLRRRPRIGRVGDGLQHGPGSDARNRRSGQAHCQPCPPARMSGFPPRRTAMQSRAEAIWEGDLMSGKGRVSSRTSGVLRDAGLSWKSRTESAGEAAKDGCPISQALKNNVNLSVRAQLA